MKSYLEWLSVIASIATLVSLAIAIVSYRHYIRERHKRQNQSSEIRGFLHGIKPMIQGMNQPGTASLIDQINDMIAKLSTPKPKKGKREK
jgi:hypothetical protein